MNRTNVIEDLNLLPLPPWWQEPRFLALAVLLLAALVGLGIWAARRRPRSRMAPPPEPLPPVPPEEFLRLLHELRQRHPALSAYQLAIEVSDILRAYLEARYRFRILYQTSREFLRDAAHRPELTPAHRLTLDGFLNRCDEVKFAQAPATPEEQAALIDTAENVIRQTAGTQSAPPTGPTPSSSHAPAA